MPVFLLRRRALLRRYIPDCDHSVPDIAVHQPRHDLTQIPDISWILSLQEVIAHSGIEIGRFTV